MSAKCSLRAVPSSLLKQNCYLRDVTVDSCSEHTPPSPTYPSLDEVVQEDGIKLVYTEQPYPVTPESVNSYVESADYRRDPTGAIANAKPRQNLGDITELQKVDSMDMDSAMALYEKLSKRIQEATKSVESKTPDASVSSGTAQSTSSSEVK